MKYHHIQSLRLRMFLILLLAGGLTGNLTAREIKKENEKSVAVNLSIIDDNYKPIKDVKILLGSELAYVRITENGKYIIEVTPEDMVILSAPGFESMIFPGMHILGNDTIRMISAVNGFDPAETVPLPHMTLKKKHLTGAYNVIKGESLVRYPSTDLRLSFAGQVPGLQVTERHGAPGTHPAEQRGMYGLGEQVSISARGRGLTYVIDGIPANITEIPLDPEEIESVTVIKDIVGKTMFGPLGADGIMYIKTRRGKINESYMNINVESGTSVIDRFPEWVTGADYARLNNQAREADGIAPLYSQSDIAAYGKNDPYDLKYPSVDFWNYMLKETRVFQRASVSARGGNETARYSSYLGFNREGDIFKIGSDADYNRLNLRSNVDIDINHFISTELDINGSLGIRRTPGYGYTTSEGQALMGIYEFNTALPHLRTTPPVEFPVYANNDPSLALPWYGISSRYANPVGNLLGSGNYTEQNRQAGVKVAVNLDLSQFVEGLTSRTAFGFDALNLIRIGQANQYEGYRVLVNENDTVFTRLQTGISDDTRRKLHDYYYIRTAFSQNLNLNRSYDLHDIESSLTYYLYRKFSDNMRDPEPQLLGVWTGTYTYNDKYSVQGVVNYAHTYSFLKGKRGGFFPSFGASWIISEEDFMSETGFIDFLKLRSEIGVLGYDPYLDPHIVRSRFVTTTRSSFGPHPLNRWFGTNVETNPSSAYPYWVGNPDLSWEKRKEFNIGIDALMLNRRLSVEVNYYNALRDGIIGRLTNSLPDVTGMSGALPYYNHNKYRYFGVETGVQYSDMTGKLNYSIGGNATFRNSKIVKYDEPNYRYEYQFRTGNPVDTYWGLNYIGKFMTDAEALVIPQLFDSKLHAGDLKYEDTNKDGVVDEHDYSAIGNTSPRLFYSLNLFLKYANFELTAIGTGAAMYDIARTSAYFHNGWGDNNYSAFVRDNIGGEYPRLTYERVNNNFVESNFWLVKGDYFKIKNVEFAYTIPASRLKFIRSNGIRFFVRGSNLLTISSVKEIDPESPTSGITSYPLYKTYTAGVSLTF